MAVFISSNDDPNNIPHGFHLIDQDLVKRNNSINETFDGFRQHGNGFAIVGNIMFLYDMDEQSVSISTFFGRNKLDQVNKSVVSYSN